MPYPESDYIMLSALQHFAFCPRQCALIHKDQLWVDSFLTMKGDLFHKRVDTYPSEKRKDVKTEFSISIKSTRLGISGKTDVVEVYYSDHNVIRVVPVEYKSGKTKKSNIDEIQLCAQAICLEEMMNIDIPIGYFYYGKEKRRSEVNLSSQLRIETEQIAEQIHQMLASESLPPPTKGSHCKSCSLRDSCQPDIFGRKKTVSQYIDNFLED